MTQSISARPLLDAVTRDACTETFRPLASDVLGWITQNDLRFAAFLPQGKTDPRLSQLRSMLVPYDR